MKEGTDKRERTGMFLIIFKLFHDKENGKYFLLLNDIQEISYCMRNFLHFFRKLNSETKISGMELFQAERIIYLFI
jgi:hypothetical protein